MFWKLPGVSASSPVESLLDKENLTLEELLDEEEIIQECKALNSRLINFLRDRTQVEQLLRYIIEEPLEDADPKRTFKFPFIACEVFTCEIDVILKTLVDEEELMDILFSFLDPNRPHSALLAGYFSKVVICLMTRKTLPLMNYIQSHQYVLRQLVDLIGITSIMEVLVRLVGADDHLYPNSMDVMQWLADSNLLEMVVDKLNPSCPAEVHANAAETLCTISRKAPSPLATKLSSPSFVARVFNHALEDSHSKSALVHSLSVCISLLDPKQLIPSPLMYSFRNQHVFESPLLVNPDTIAAMLPKLADLLMVLDVLSDENSLSTTYGVLKPPFGKHRLKVVEFLAVLLKTRNDIAEKELVSSGAIQKILDLFFEYPYNNALHHLVERIVYSCLESKNVTITHHLFRECNLVGKILQADNVPTVSGDFSPQTVLSSGRNAPRAGYIGHITRMSNELVQFSKTDSSIQVHLLENLDWNDWQSSVLQERNIVENVYRWACGRPTALQDRRRDSDEEDIHDRDYDVTAFANSLSKGFRDTICGNEDTEEGHGPLGRYDEDVYFDDESAEVVISSLRLGDDQGRSLFTNSNWFAFKDDAASDANFSSSGMELEEINLNGTSGSGNSSSDDEPVVGEDEQLHDGRNSSNGSLKSRTGRLSGTDGGSSFSGEDLNHQNENNGTSGDMGAFQFESSDNNDLFGDRPIPEWAAWAEASDFQVSGSSSNPFLDPVEADADVISPVEQVATPSSSVSSVEVASNDASTSAECPVHSSGSDSCRESAGGQSLFKEDVEFVGVELGGTEKARAKALMEGIVEEAGATKRNLVPKKPEKENPDDGGAGLKEFNDTNYWRVDQEVAVSE